ncbi:hypothetical protein LEL_03768 [Akanthomyces lecanii RCEF 1005]|uniref:Uncharacterized protein n=1 Tax=Akanthomyces lecanii RCEF 1005 TaxID=1081108 RepID=A0A162KB75_CORDF|nr:hypothetical protein LEL_03768 [Akanthomyces lecanii RCEF 1005]
MLLSNFQPPQWERMATSLSRCGPKCTAQRILKVLGVTSELLRHPTKQRLTQYHKVVFSLATSSFQSGILQGDNCLSTTESACDGAHMSAYEQVNDSIWHDRIDDSLSPEIGRQLANASSLPWLVLAPL